MLRNTAQCALRNFGTWWMDLGATGWFNDPRMWAEMARLEALDEPLLSTPRPVPARGRGRDRRAEHDPRGGRRARWSRCPASTRPAGRWAAWARPTGNIFRTTWSPARCHAKMYVFLTAWCLAPDQRETLLAATRGSTRVWCYAPGYQETGRTSLDAMRELTGFQLAKVTSARPWPNRRPLAQKLGLHAIRSAPTPSIKPLFAAADATAEETLATYPDGSAAIALRRTCRRTVAVCRRRRASPPSCLRLGRPERPASTCSRSSDCNVYANGPYLVLHASQDGPLEIDAGAPRPDSRPP